ncbi:PREDICTED: uncharacterized protein LOC104610550 isoform X2 [Nelumbo nucifera]|uniref:Uncharacterized protein LOC104610550 isoform X2 n=1 Tax=Nelumbo nucifera TaxID=4432 RepID=A0A1U8QBM2_NELNU|nr:PREDICTED: uncharacterized protein LOC104610550 isoform X2 [Nelumbo nucifera]
MSEYNGAGFGVGFVESRNNLVPVFKKPKFESAKLSAIFGSNREEVGELCQMRISTGTTLPVPKMIVSFSLKLIQWKARGFWRQLEIMNKLQDNRVLNQLQELLKMEATSSQTQPLLMGRLSFLFFGLLKLIL